TLTADPGLIADFVSLAPYHGSLIVSGSSGPLHYDLMIHFTIDLMGAVEPPTIIHDGNDEFAVLGPAQTDVHRVADPDPTGGLPAGTSAADFPRDFFSFAVHGLAPGQHVVLTLMLYNLQPTQTVNRYFKFGPTPGNSTPHWYDFTYNPATDLGAE